MRPLLSKRLNAVAPSATLAVTEKAAALRAKGVDVISFGAGEPDFPTPAHIREAALKALRDGDTKYPAPVAGKTVLRTAVCEYLERFCGTKYEPADVIATVGAKDALYYAFASLLDPGDEVVIPKPYWVSYPDQVRLAEGSPVFVHDPDDELLKVGAREIESALTPRTRVVVLNSPNNPTGAVYSRDELQDIADLLRGKDIVIVSDEIYHRLIFGDRKFTSFSSLPGMMEQTLVVNGVSKTFAMTGWRLGFAAGPRWLVAAMAKLQGQTTSGPASFVQTAAAAALRGPQDDVAAMRTVYERRGERMAERLNAIRGVRCGRPQGAFYCFPDMSSVFERVGVHNADEFAEAVLDRVHVALVSGGPFGAPAHVRLSYSTSDAAIEEGLNRLSRLLA
ncbi:MAG: pyridoxal phosphate-dependent aminotransferase [Planctomycetes bacterium]|nr:pyridoxal phosphate-dependent aminotransferase [Planctomycetota bacterium]